MTSTCSETRSPQSRAGGRIDALAVSNQDLLSPAFRIRIGNLMPELRRSGILMRRLALFSSDASATFSAGNSMSQSLLALHARSALMAEIAAIPSSVEVALVQRQVDIFPTTALERAVAHRRRLVYDIDDAIWLSLGFRPSWLKIGCRKAHWLAAHADHVIAGNEFLAEYLSRFSDAITVVPSVIDTEAVPIREHQRRQRLVIGWIGSPSTAPYLERIAHLVDRVGRTLGDTMLELLVVGGAAPSSMQTIRREAPWSERRERAALSEIDIGIMPLPDTPWARGKCAYKAIQYMASGIPVVADAVGVASQVVGNDIGGFLVSSEDDWVEALLALAQDAALRLRLGRQGRARVEQEYSVRRWAPVVADLLRG